MAKWLITYDGKDGGDYIAGAVYGTPQDASDAALAQTEQDIRLYRVWKHAAKVEFSGDFSVVPDDGTIVPGDGE